jgi:hypothetical protein
MAGLGLKNILEYGDAVMIEYTKIQPPALTGDPVADRKNYIETCFKMDFEGAKHRKSVAVKDTCDLGDGGLCDMGGLAPDEEIPLDPMEPVDYVYVWDKCGDSDIFDMASEPGEIVEHVDRQIESMRAAQLAAQSIGAGSARRRRRY